MWRSFDALAIRSFPTMGNCIGNYPGHLPNRSMLNFARDSSTMNSSYLMVDSTMLHCSVAVMMRDDGNCCGLRGV